MWHSRPYCGLCQPNGTPTFGVSTSLLGVLTYLASHAQAGTMEREAKRWSN